MGRSLGTIEFGALSPDGCDVIGVDDGIVACGVLTIVHVTVPAPGVSAALVEDVEGSTRDGGLRGESLGFYFFGAEDVPTGLQLTIGFQPRIETQSAIVELRTLFYRGGSTDLSAMSRSFDVPARAQ